MIVLLIAGTLVILGGLAAIGFGIPVKEFGFGNTLILTGTVGVCTGLIMISIAIALRELKKMNLHPVDADHGTRRGRQMPLLDEEPDLEPEDEAEPAAGDSPLFARDRAPPRPSAPEPGVPPWQDEVLRDRERLLAAAEKPEEPKRRNLLFSSSRRERERMEAEGEVDQVETTAAPAPSPRIFDDVAPPSERPRSDAIRRAARAPLFPPSDRLPDESLIPDRYEPPAPREPARAPGVTVLKSGVVDGMAYSLYSDGSIEAQMPEGMMRFGSIDELREHLDNRG